MHFLQNPGTVAFAEREAAFLSEFSAAGHRKSLVVVPPFTSPLDEGQNNHLNSQFDSTSVSLCNIRDHYIAVKEYTLTCLGLEN